ncbi:MAG: tRNA 2-thiouridine(34) synthase MnmA [Gemmatimonadales bacterium]|nr:tRNA 2-thiouridine(34) synthase MnmA [Gemmatimonadales bacterium]
MTFPLPVPAELRRALLPGTEVLLGISGGVDSAVSLALLVELGCRVQCVTFKNFCYGDPEIELTEKSCCSLEAIEDARALAGRFGAQHWVHDLAEPFGRRVMEPFVAEYQVGRTPNPCLACNGDVRFPELVRLADRQGCSFAATGHYARIERRGEYARLLRGLDREKDQSYFLSRIEPVLLDRFVFPLGWWTKEETRRAAAELGLSVAGKRDSQEICFVPDGDRSFLFPEGPSTVPGDIVNRGGRILGRHRGLVHYTVGQRRGMGVAAERPLYVLELDLEKRRLVVGFEEELKVDFLTADRFLAQVPDFPDSGTLDDGVRARIRHRHRGVPVKNWRLSGEGLTVELEDAVLGAAPGQGLVLYDGDLVLGGGRILTAGIGPE